MFSEIDRGLTLKFLYPRHNFQGVRSARERRRVLIEEVRNLDYEPLEPATIAVQPLLNRGRLLVTGIDLDKRERRSFYYESMAELEIVGGEDDRQKHRVYVLDPSGEVPPILAFASDNVAQAMTWVANWEQDHAGHVAVLWPLGAEPPKLVKLAREAACA